MPPRLASIAISTRTWKKIVDFLLARSVGQAERFADEFEAAVERILAFPESGRVLEDGVRSLRIDGGPFSILYKVDNSLSAVEFLAIAHASRRPGYWKDRV
ncbi:MAG: type II toxin-antitoxin system RelE/ParE family toxin [Dehalococcoidia bacterium]